MPSISRSAWLLPLCALGLGPPSIERDKPPSGVRRVVFLGDSITYSGQYIEYLETYLRLEDPSLRCEFLDLGLPSETVSGLTEPGHAGGQFPRPDLHERLDRVLKQARPDLVVACYGMNDGIYHPLDDDRFRRYQAGIRLLREKATAAGARVLHLTPPVFDPSPIRSSTLPAGLAEYRQPFEGYDSVLEGYSEWLLARRPEGWDVVDIHGPMKAYLARERERDPNFRLAKDGVHIDATGHWLMARAILAHWDHAEHGLGEASSIEQALKPWPGGLDVLQLVQRKQSILKDAWLTSTGHRRPGMRPGLPLSEAEKQAAGLESRILERLKPMP